MQRAWLRVLGMACVAIGWAAPLRAQEWQPPAPNPTEKDWVRLNSGEWLKGDIKSLRDDKFEFDSSELELLHLDWDDVAELRSPRALTFVSESAEVMTGPAAMRDGVIRINTSSGPSEMQRARLVSIIEGRPRELNYWSANADVTFVARSGNTDQIDTSIVTLLRREATRSRLDLGYTGNAGKLNGATNINNHRASAKLDWFISRGFFATPASYEYYADDFQNIEFRQSLSAGLGYFVVRRSGAEWEVGLGTGYQLTRSQTVPEGENPDQRDGSIIPSTKASYDITKDIDVSASYEAQIGMRDIRNTFHHFYGALGIDLISILDLTASLTWDRNENPRADDTGVVPKRDDFRIALGFGLDI